MLIFLHLVALVGLILSVSLFLQLRKSRRVADKLFVELTAAHTATVRAIADRRVPDYSHATLADRIAESIYVRLMFDDHTPWTPAGIRNAAHKAYELAEALIDAREDWRNV